MHGCELSFCSASVRFAAVQRRQIDAGDGERLRAVDDLQALRLIDFLNRRVDRQAREVPRLVLRRPRRQHPDMLLDDARFAIEDEGGRQRADPGNSFSISGVIIATG